MNENRIHFEQIEQNLLKTCDDGEKEYLVLMEL